MNIVISNDLNNYRLQGVENFLALGESAVAWAEIYSGTQPAFGQAPSGTLLAVIDLPEPLGTISDGALILTPSEEKIISASGIATWARIKNGLGQIAWDCDVSGTNGNGAMKISSENPDIPQLYAGGFTRLVSGTLS